MDNLTHSLVGALIGQAGLKRKTGLAMPALIIGANLPDIDATCVLLGGTQHLALRRGITHGPIAWVALPLVLAGLLWAFDRWQAKRGRRPEKRLPVSFTWLYLLSLIACLTHPALDWLNVYGIRLLAPFSQRWFYGDTLFIIDIWLWLGLGLASWLSLRREKRGGDWRLPARAALAAALAYAGANHAITWAAENGARMREPHPRIVIASPVPVFFWRRQMITGNGDGHWRIDGREVGDFDLLPKDKPDIARAVKDAGAFLVWSRTPYIERDESGAFYLRDARFGGRPGGLGFAVRLPEAVCKPLNP